MEDGAGRRKRGAWVKGKLFIVVSTTLLIAILASALVLTSASRMPVQENDDDQMASDDGNDSKTTDSEDGNELVSGVASDFILDGRDMGASWDASEVNTDISQIGGYPTSLHITSAAGIIFSQNNYTGSIHYRIEVTVMVFSTADDAAAYYDNRTEIHPQDDSNIAPEFRPSYPVLLANVSIGDRGAVIDGPHITLGHEAKAIFTLNKNVACTIMYHDMTSYDPLPNQLLIDLANKMNAKIV
ncbi:MAG: hypothetical protein SA339_09825 [Methanomassiliicoccus sp.]|nr:hypothetical protein [Methanomassiliicoccus sp.]